LTHRDLERNAHSAIRQAAGQGGPSTRQRRRESPPQHLGRRGLPLQRLVTLSFTLGKFGLTLGKLTFEIAIR
jgi:hypothetical protein